MCLCYSNLHNILAPVKDSINKRDKLFIMASAHSIDISSIGESIISDEDLRIPGFQLPYRRIRNRHGGGVAVFVSETLSSCR